MSEALQKPKRQLWRAAYDVEGDRIAVRFGAGAVYRYSFDSVGREHVIRMIELAEAGCGLAEYIATRPEVRDGYERKD